MLSWLLGRKKKDAIDRAIEEHLQSEKRIEQLLPLVEKRLQAKKTQDQLFDEAFAKHEKTLEVIKNRKNDTLDRFHVFATNHADSRLLRDIADAAK